MTELIYGFDPAPHLHDGRSFAPVQELVSALGGSYSWDETTRTMEVELHGASAGSASAPAPVHAVHSVQAVTHSAGHAH